MTKDYALAVCRDYIKVVVGNDDTFSYVILKGDNRMAPLELRNQSDVKTTCVVDKELAEALKTLLSKDEE